MTAEERAAAAVVEWHGRHVWGYDPVQHAELQELIADQVRAAETAAAGRQRQRFLALIAEARSWWERGNCPEVMETVQAALDQLRLAVLAGQPSGPDAGGGGAGGAT
jgi:hypothetical protein